jgi:hypothetical protein
MSDEYQCDWTGYQSDFPAVIWKGNGPFIQANALSDGELFLDITDDEVAFLLRAACKAALVVLDSIGGMNDQVNVQLRDALAKAEGKP